MDIEGRSDMKTLVDVKKDMSELYEQVKSGDCELKFAAELANITGKFLKAEQLMLAREIFVKNHIELKSLPNGLSE